MQIKVRLSEPFWRAAGQRDLEIELEPPATVSTLLAALCRDFPALEPEMAAAVPSIFVGEREVDGSAALEENNKVYIVWPVAGG